MASVHNTAGIGGMSVFKVRKAGVLLVPWTQYTDYSFSDLEIVRLERPENVTPIMHRGDEGKAIPLQTLTGPEFSRRLRLTDFKAIDTCRWKDCRPYAPAAFTP